MNFGSSFFLNNEYDAGQRTGDDPDRNAELFEPKLYHHHGKDKLGGLDSCSGGGLVVPKISPEPHIASQGIGSGIQSGILGRLYVIGPLSLVDNSNRNLTPRGQKAQGLLALLALAPRGTRTRSWLRDKLWSTSDEKKSASSLRQTVFEIKRDLGELADQILMIERYSIGLHLDRIWIDHKIALKDAASLKAMELAPDADILEGIDIADIEFEDWLMMERQIWFDKSNELLRGEPTPSLISIKNNTSAASQIITSVASSPPVEILSPIAPSYSLGLLPNIMQGCDTSTQHLADHLVEGIARNLREFQPVTIFDLRDPSLHSDKLVNSFETEYYIRVRALHVRDSITLTFFLYRASQMTLEWSQSIQANVSELMEKNDQILHGFVSQNVDRLAKTMFEHKNPLNGPSDMPGQTGYSALNLMFRLDASALEHSRAVLYAAQKENPNSLFPALQSYLSSFMVGENMGIMDIERALETKKFVKHVMDDNSFNSISLACLGHVMGYVFREHDVAEDLLNRALNLDTNQAFIWDHYALHKVYTGEYETAYEAAQKAVYLGSYSPLSYSYDTTLSMASTLVGDHGRAIMAGKTALRKQPKFTAAMRYLLVNYEATGQVGAAQEIYKELLKLDPDFEDPEVQKERFRLSDKEGERRILTTLRKTI
ncbi:MAG: hypothetical protein QM488_13335 [Rhizobiaceae bacterium]